MVDRIAFNKLQRFSLKKMPNMTCWKILKVVLGMKNSLIGRMSLKSSTKLRTGIVESTANTMMKSENMQKKK